MENLRLQQIRTVAEEKENSLYDKKHSFKNVSDTNREGVFRKVSLASSETLSETMKHGMYAFFFDPEFLNSAEHFRTSCALTGSGFEFLQKNGFVRLRITHFIPRHTTRRRKKRKSSLALRSCWFCLSLPVRKYRETQQPSFYKNLRISISAAEQLGERRWRDWKRRENKKTNHVKKTG